jgi:hypothetical protein
MPSQMLLQKGHTLRRLRISSKFIQKFNKAVSIKGVPFWQAITCFSYLKPMLITEVFKDVSFSRKGIPMFRDYHEVHQRAA